MKTFWLFLIYLSLAIVSSTIAQTTLSRIDLESVLDEKSRGALTGAELFKVIEKTGGYIISDGGDGSILTLLIDIKELQEKGTVAAKNYIIRLDGNICVVSPSDPKLSSNILSKKIPRLVIENAAVGQALHDIGESVNTTLALLQRRSDDYEQSISLKQVDTNVQGALLEVARQVGSRHIYLSENKGNERSKGWIFVTFR